eukprot:GHUV01049171.1.p1 GENE.GHUV01049171.1~~GHUV01049171.1.p1  ORF type:complete len:161 (-),score=26.70 GHUV01049171.1:113-595(-)
MQLHLRASGAWPQECRLARLTGRLILQAACKAWPVQMRIDVLLRPVWVEFTLVALGLPPVYNSVAPESLPLSIKQPIDQSSNYLSNQVACACTCYRAVQIAGMTDIFEGSIIRVARRLDELMQQLARAAQVVGDETLAKRFEESNETLRRGIMFSASLYL